MLGILIVDNEELACADILYKVSRSGFYFKWIMEASSAEEALEKIREYKPDILLTDIIMGEMSGMELVKEAKNYVPNIAAVLISGYSEFHYAKKAIALGVVDYLVKPVRQEEITDVLSKVIAREMHRRNLLQSPAGGEKSEDHRLSESQREELTSFLYGTKANPGFSLNEIYPGTARYFQIGVFRISAKLHFNRLRQMIQDIIGEVGGPWFLTFYNPAPSRQITIIAASPEKDRKKAEKILLGSFGEINCRIHKQLDIVLFGGVSGVEKSLSGELLTQARQVLDLRFSVKGDSGGRTFYWREWEKAALPKLPEEDFKLYQRLLTAGDLNEALATVRRIFSTDVPETAMHIRLIYMELICILARTCIKKAGGGIVSMLGPECLSGGIIDKFDSREELIDNLCRTITTALGQWVAVTADTRSVLMVVRSYIENNYTNPEIGTNFLSKEFCISLGYLSTSFNKEFGIPITKYIIKLRMGYAKRLLKKTSLCIHDIAENCGFRNVSYFMRTFKKQVGCTPNEFREKRQGIVVKPTKIIVKNSKIRG
ncbi:MAG: helix-turn-helix domain-containing protein [Lachnospiraceae bacterium]|nr:helix-turn-helix domain-containing protein [Lachnospiraceae bacterium]